MVSTISEETYDELNYLLREMISEEQPVQRRITIASGEDLFNEHGEHLYATFA